MKTLPIARLCLAATCLLLVACSGGAVTPGSSPTTTANPGVPTPGVPTPGVPTPTARTTLDVTTAAQAAALVFASDPRWSAITPLRADLIGASLWYDASADADGFGVRVTAGAGDCQAGCIMQRTWTYHVDANGTVALVNEAGDEVAFDLPTGTDAQARVAVALSAGPVCPVERNPPDPACAPRSVANATVRLFTPDGAEVANALSDASGHVEFNVPKGAYYVVAEPVEGLMGTPEPQALAVLGGNAAELVLGYDTGIR